MDKNNISNKRLDKVERILEKMVIENEKFRSHMYGTTYNLGTEVEKSIEAHFQEERNNDNLKIGDTKFDFLRTGVGESGIFELDFLLLNSVAVGLVEVKRNLRISNISKFFSYTLPKFEEYYPEYKEKKKICIFVCKNFKDKRTEIEENLRNIKRVNKKFILEEKKDQKFNVIAIN